MNKVSRTEEPYEGNGYNQNPSALSSDLTTNAYFNGIINDRASGDREVSKIYVEQVITGQPDDAVRSPTLMASSEEADFLERDKGLNVYAGMGTRDTEGDSNQAPKRRDRKPRNKAWQTMINFSRFVGPGFLISVAYIDPGNYATAIGAGASYRFRLLFIVLMSNLFAIMLQSLAIKLGSVTGYNLAEACRAYLPRWLNIFLYLMAEAAIIATDMAEVIGTAIALNLLCPKIPLVVGCALSILDVLLILIFYRPNGGKRELRSFEFFVAALVLGVVICFCIQLSLIQDVTPGEVFKGYIPNSAVTQSEGLYQACGILGATVMPHSLYLGSGMVQSRLKEYDVDKGLLPEAPPEHDGDSDDGKGAGRFLYVPSLRAIKHSLKYSYAELAISLFTFALFVNSAILIVAGASLYQNDKALGADIFGIHDLLSMSISKSAGTLFALALLFSGISAGIICTISGQLVSEGALNWKMKPWLRRLITRSISITPSIIIAGATGREKLNAALTGSQVALSIVLPFTSLPLIWFTCFNKYMTVKPDRAGWQKKMYAGRVVVAASGEHGDDGSRAREVRMANTWWWAIIAGAIWLIIVIMNVANLVLLGLGKA